MNEERLPSHEGEENSPRQPLETPEMKCPKCGNHFPAVFPNARIQRSVAFTILIWIHETPLECPHCEQKFIFTFRGVQGITATWTPVEHKPQPKIEIPPAGFDVSKLPPMVVPPNRR